MSVDFPAPFTPTSAAAAFDEKVHVRKHALGAVALIHFHELGHHAPTGFGLRKIEVDGGFFRRHFDAFDPLQFLDAALHQLGLRSLGAEAGDERLQLLGAARSHLDEMAKPPR
jgi:hypothetical protein